MQKRYASVYFPYLLTDQLLLRRPELAGLPLVVAGQSQGKQICLACCKLARAQGIRAGTVLADARVMVTGLQVHDHHPGREEKLLRAIGEWAIRYSPMVGVDAPSGLVLDVTGCAHLWGGEQGMLTEISSRLSSKGYQVRCAVSDTQGTAWAMARYCGNQLCVVSSGEQAAAIAELPPEALRPEPEAAARLHKLGFYRVGSFMALPSSVLRRRFGQGLVDGLARALGWEEETLVPIRPAEPYTEQLTCLEPVRTARAIGIATRRLLEMLCGRLQAEGKGLRTAVLRAQRVDGAVEQVGVSTSMACHDAPHLHKLLALQISRIRPGLGLELFVLAAGGVEDLALPQEALWAAAPGLSDGQLGQLLDRLAGKAGPNAISRYLPAEHYWPGRETVRAVSLETKADLPWRTGRPRPVLLLAEPERVDVAAPIPDYPPMLFCYQGKVHYIGKADGPERIEREWWLDQGQHRDYYVVEDQWGQRYWLFRSGHYQHNQSHQWFLHGFFA